nr:hypothetical protein [Tanacetum cinerariifolium]
MHTRSSSNLPVVSSNPSTSNPKCRNRRRSKQPFILEESPVDTMADQRTMAELLRAPTEGYAEAIVVPSILAEQFELKHSLINMMTSDQFFGLKKDNPNDHIRWFNKITSTIKYKDVPNSAIKLMLFPFSLAGAACRFTELHQLDTFYNALNPADQDSLNAAAGGNLLERRTQDVLKIIENKAKVRNSRSKSVVSQVKPCDINSNSSSEIAKLTHAVNQQTSAMTTTMTAMLKQFQATPPPASVKVIEETCVTCAAVNYNQGNPGYRPLGSGSLPSNTVANPKGELKAITTHSGIVLDGPIISTPPQSINPEVDERVEETFTDPNLAEYTIKVPPPPIQKYKPLSQREYLHINITLADALILMPKYQKMLKDLMSNKEKLQELANTPLKENCSAVILKKLPKKLRDPWKFLIPCGFSELKCKALADLGASINLMPLSVWKKLGLPEFISTRMTLELANRAICTPAGIARDVFVSVGKFTFPADFVIVNYESDPRVPLILGRPFLWTARALINKESINFINVFNNSSDDFLEDVFSNQPSGNPTFSSHPELTLQKFNDDIFDLEGSNVLSEKLLDLNSTKDLHPPLYDNQLSCSTNYSIPLLEEFADELAFPSKFDDDLQFDIESDLKEIEFMIYQDIDSNIKDSIDQKVESDAENIYDDPFDSKGEKIKESKLLIDELDFPCDFLLSEYDSLVSQDFSRLILSPQPTTRTDPPFYEPHFFKEVPSSKMLLLFSSKNKEKVFKPGIHTSEKVHSSFIPELSHPGYKIFKINQIFKNPMKIFLFFCGKNTHILAVPYLHFYPLDQLKYGGNWVKLSDPKQALRGRHLMLIRSFSNEQLCLLCVIVVETHVSFVPGQLASRLGCAETKVVTWDDLAFKLITLGWNVKHENFSKNADPRLKFDVDEIKTKNNELEHKVASLMKENEHLKLVYKKLFDSIKNSRVQTQSSNVSPNEAEKLKSQLSEFTDKKFDNIFQKIESMKKKKFDSRISNDKSLCDSDSLIVKSKSKEKKLIFENKTSSFRTKIKELEMTLVQQTKDFEDAKDDFLKKTDKFETYFEKLEKTRVVLKRQLDYLISNQKEYSDLRTSYNALKSKFDSLNQDKGKSSISNSSTSKKEEDLRGDNVKHHEAEIEAMNLILIFIPNYIYNSVDACTTAKAMWQRVERLMRGSLQNKVDKETHFNNEFDQFVDKSGEALVVVYNCFSQLMNDLERIGIIFLKVTLNTKFLNCLQLEWLKYVTQVHLAKRLIEDSYDDLFDYLKQFEKVVNASRAKKLDKTHDPLALVAYTGSLP